MKGSRNFSLAVFVAVAWCPSVGYGERGPEGVYVVEPGDSLWAIARRHGCSVDDVATANDLRTDGLLRVGARLSLETCRDRRSTRHRSTLHRVAEGETIAEVARHYGIPPEVVLDLNAGLRSSRSTPESVHVGDVLLVPPTTAEDVELALGQSVGRPQRGRLLQSVRLPQGRGVHVRHPDRAYGAQHVVSYTAAVLGFVRRLHPQLHEIAIGDLSAPRGGWISGHRSHQSGRDVDVGLCFRRVPEGYPDEFMPHHEAELDIDAMWTLVSAFAATHALPGGVERIFLDYDIQAALYEYGREKGMTDGQLRALFQAPDGRSARHGIVRHEPKHHDHVHVRFRCLEGDRRCR